MQDFETQFDRFIVTIHDDYTGVWWIAHVYRYQEKIESDAEVKEKTLQMVRELLKHDIGPGYLAPEGKFDFWQGTEDELMTRVESEWPAKGIPSLDTPMCWLAVKK